MRLRIIKDGIEHDHRDIDVDLLRFNPPSVNTEFTTETFSGMSGSIVTSGKHTGRAISVVFLARGKDHIDLQLIQSELYALFTCDKPFRVIDDRQPGKFWEVVSTGGITMEYIDEKNSRVARFTVPLECFFSFAQSVFRTAENEFSFDSDKLQWGMGIVVEEKPLIYKFTTTTFRVYNAGNQKVDWRNCDALLTYKGASNNLRIRNRTTGTDWRYSGTSNASDTIRLLKGARATKNSSTIARDTNLAAMTLAPGWNEFEISGTSGSFELLFDFRFLYA